MQAPKYHRARHIPLLNVSAVEVDLSHVLANRTQTTNLGHQRVAAIVEEAHTVGVEVEGAAPFTGIVLSS